MLKKITGRPLKPSRNTINEGNLAPLAVDSHQWIVLAIGFVVSFIVALAVVAFSRVRRLSRRLDRLTESYWELRYEYTELRAGIARLESPVGDGEPKTPSPPSTPQNFVPLSSLKR